MKNLNVKSLLIASIIAYLLGVSAFLSSFFVPILSDPKVQANLVLALAIIPASILGAHIYYRRGHQTYGLYLGASMFLVTMLLDALITVPLFVIPAGGNHLSFFTDPGFWLIGIEYILAVAAYRRVTNTSQNKPSSRALSSQN